MYKLLICLLFATIPASFVVIANPVLSQPSNTPSNTQPTVDTLTQKIAQIEVQRAIESTRYISASPIIQKLDLQLKNLRQRLVQLRPDGNKKAVNLAINKTVKTKIAQLEIERADQITKFSRDSPVIVIIDSQIKNLQQLLVRR